MVGLYAGYSFVLVKKWCFEQNHSKTFKIEDIVRGVAATVKGAGVGRGGRMRCVGGKRGRFAGIFQHFCNLGAFRMGHFGSRGYALVGLLEIGRDAQRFVLCAGSWRVDWPGIGH